MDLPALVDAYGYVAVFIGAFLEGETVLALAGLAANRGYLDLRWVILIALVAGFLGDQFFFFLGRVRGHEILRRFPHWRERADRFDAMLARWHAPLIVAIRFMYGFRILGPILLGMGRCPAGKFVVFNLVGAMLWAPLIAGLGYLFGAMLERTLENLKHVELWAFVALLALGLLLSLVHRFGTRESRRGPPHP